MGSMARQESENRSSQDDRGANGTRATKQPQPRRRPQAVQDEEPEQEPVEGTPDEPVENGPDEAADDVPDPQG
jgi:hypothetical protein